MRLKDKVAIVVGAGQAPGDTVGNGRAAAVAFAREGAKVFITDLVTENMHDTQRDIAALGGDCEVMQMDVTQEADCAAMVAQCEKRFGQVDILHHNVGIAGGDAPAVALERDGWDRMLEVNTTGFFLTTKHTLPVMRARQSGCIIAISSIAALWTMGTAVAYKCSKAAMNAFVQSTAVSNAKYGVRVNAILPGLMDTPIAIEATRAATGLSAEEIRANRDARVPLRNKMGTAWDVANAAVFLASDEAGFITGVCLPVDGGQSAKVG
ncbi:MAG: SDR family oxidoreductase [Gammaproteobacteria bacterium]|nr:SDR family oxidoreductase [Gammaproteobacteria bacterium]